MLHTFELLYIGWRRAGAALTKSTRAVPRSASHTPAAAHTPHANFNTSKSQSSPLSVEVTQLSPPSTAGLVPAPPPLALAPMAYVVGVDPSVSATGAFVKTGMHRFALELCTLYAAEWLSFASLCHAAPSGCHAAKLIKAQCTCSACSCWA